MDIYLTINQVNLIKNGEKSLHLLEQTDEYEKEHNKPMELD